MPFAKGHVVLSFGQIERKCWPSSGGTSGRWLLTKLEVQNMKQVCIPREDVSPEDLVAYVAWLRLVPWQLFCTLTFAWPVSDPQAVKVFGEFVNRVERFLRCPIGLVRGDEKRFSGCGMPGAPRHFHALLAAHVRLDKHWIADVWMNMAGRRKNGSGADVRFYDPKLPGLAYVLKFINHPNGDWDLRNIDLFMQTCNPEDMNCRQRRRLARQAKRSQIVRMPTRTSGMN